MDPERWLRIRSIFERAIELPEAERAGFVDAECGDDADLREHVGNLLASDTDRTERAEFLERTPATDRAVTRSVPLWNGDRVGRYVIQRTIGRGGMGTVYEAVQDDPRRTVAIKVCNHGLLTETSERRFRFESEVLARLRHPGIAQIHEAGTFEPPGCEAPVPFFAMECVENARDLATFAEQSGLTRRERLELLIQACDAVHHGHQQGVIHRDLKPANILVDDHGRPKIIDFGIARVTASDAVDPTMLTLPGQLIGTLSYASPEQVGGRSSEIDTRSDVYSLGVIVFELLTGELPFDLGDTSLPSAARMVVEREPPALGSIDRGLRGDLETIVGKALEKDPARRYQSASELGADLQNYLDDRPILARPPSAIYQLRKLARRHRVAFTAAVVMVLTMTVGLVVVGYQNLRIQSEQQRTGRVSAFLREILTAADALQRGKDFTMREALDLAAARIDGELADDSTVEAEIRHVVGETYRNLAVHAAAEEHLTRALEIREGTFGPDDPATLETLRVLALLRWDQDRAAEAVELGRTIRDTSRRLHGDDDLQALIDAHNLAQCLKADGRVSEAEALYRDTLARRSVVLGADALDTASTRHNLGKLLLDEGRLDEAEELLLDALRVREAEFGPDHFETLITADVLGMLHRAAGALDASERAHRRALEGFQRQLGPDHDHTLAAAANLVWVLISAGRFSEAAPLASETLDACRRVFGDDHSHTLNVMRMAAAAAAQNGDLERGEELLRECHESSRRRHGAAHPNTVRAAHDLVFFLRGTGRFEQGLEVVRAIEIDSAAGGDAARFRGPGLMLEGLCLLGLSRFEDAERSLLRSLDLNREAFGANTEQELASLSSLVELYAAWERPVRRAEYEALRDTAAAARAARAGRDNGRDTARDAGR